MKKINYNFLLSFVAITTIIVSLFAFNENETNISKNFLDSETYGIGEIAESTDTLTTSVSFRNLSGQSNLYLLYIHVDSANTGTIKFSLNESMEWPNDSTPPTYNYKAWGAGATLQITVSNNRNLFYKASATGQKFIVTN